MCIITSVCGCVRVAMRIHAIMPLKRGISILLSGLPLKHHLCECQFVYRQCKSTQTKIIIVWLLELCFLFLRKVEKWVDIFQRWTLPTQ